MTKKIILKGTYCIIIHLKEKTTIEVGKKGHITFKKGYYVYVGSALNSLKSRLKRHLSSNKKLFWHVDYLLASSNAKIIDIVFAVDEGKWECHLASKIANKGDPILSFGCSDCKCSSHLFQFEEIEKSIKTCVNAFKIINLEPKMLDDLELKN
jgi:Uri superfamily endonuclease